MNNKNILCDFGFLFLIDVYDVEVWCVELFEDYEEQFEFLRELGWFDGVWYYFFLVQEWWGYQVQCEVIVYVRYFQFL